MKKSTRDLFKKHGWRADRAIHNYIYFVFYFPYVRFVLLIIKYGLNYLTWFKPLKIAGDFVFNRYHGKLLSLDDTKKILTLNEDISATTDKNKKIIPFKYAYKIIIREPDKIAVMDCPCKKSMNAPDWSINSCLYVGKGHEFWLDHCKNYNPRKISQEEALNLIKKLRERGHITQAFFKVATGGSAAGVICNCHPESCVSLIATKFTRRIHKNLSQQIESGYSVRHDEKKCNRCFKCIETCHFSALSIQGGKFVYDKDLCLGCGLCVEHCPESALSLYTDSEKSVPLDIDMIKKEFV